MTASSPLIRQAAQAIPSALLQALRERKSFAVIGHLHPDVDTLGSSLALAGLLRKIDRSRNIIIANAERLPKQLRFLPKQKNILMSAKASDIRGYDCGIFLECSSLERAGRLGDPKLFKVTLNMDHHKGSQRFAAINWIDAKASSLAEQVYLLYEALGYELSRDEAICLYSGIVSDTGGFQYSLTRPLTHLIAAHLLSKKIPHTQIAEVLFTQKTPDQLKLLGRALRSLIFLKNGMVAWMELLRKDFRDLECPVGQTENIANFGLAVPQVQVAVLVKEDLSRGCDCLSVSFRSRGKFDASRLAKNFGGGGHFHASGCEFYGKTMDEVRQVLLKKIGMFL